MMMKKDFFEILSTINLIFRPDRIFLGIMNQYSNYSFIFLFIFIYNDTQHIHHRILRFFRAFKEYPVTEP